VSPPATAADGRRRRRGDEIRVRRRAGLLLALAGALLAVSAAALWGALAVADPDVDVAVPLLVTLAVVVALTLAGILNFQLRRLAEQVVAWAAVIAAGTALVLAALGAALLLLGRVPVGSERAFVAPALAAVVLAVLVSPLVTTRIRRSIAHRLHGRRRSPQEVLDTFGSRVPGTDEQDQPGAGSGSESADDELLRELAEALARSLGARHVEIWTQQPTGLQRVLALPERPELLGRLSAADTDVLVRADVAGAAWLRLWLPHLLAGRSPEVRLAPALYSRTVLGLLVVERSINEVPFSSADERQLSEVAARLGVVLHNRELDSALKATLLDLQRTNDQLRASRTRLVATADRERRRLERDLHDGAQQHLVALAVNLGLARQLLDDDPGAVRELLDETADAIRETVQQLRDLAHGIYPPLLMDAGIGEALRAASARSPLSVRVQVDGLRRYPAEVEAAVYFCCLEALQNAAKHAPGASVQVLLRETDEDRLLTFEVADDGPGFGGAAATAGAGGSGQGLQNMADRLGAVGGTVVWEDAPGGGARVRGSVPVAAAPTPDEPVDPPAASAATISVGDAG
jgi:signal transduction histidine kinase